MTQKGNTTSRDVNIQSQEGRKLERILSEYHVRVNAGVMWGGAESYSIVGSSIDGSNVAMFTDLLEAGERLPSVMDYEGDEALPALTKIICKRMRDAGIDNYTLDVEKKDLN